MLLGALVNSQSQMPKSSLQALHSLRGSSAPVDRASPLALAFRPVGDETDMARLALCPLAAVPSPIAPPGARATDARHLRRSMLDRCGALPHERRSRTRPSAAARIVALSRIECAHLRDLRRQARSLFLQPRRSQSTCSLGRPRLFHLPYFHAAMTSEERNETIHYSCHRRGASAEFRGRYRPIAPVQPRDRGSLEHWLTERYCLYTVHDGAVYRGEIHHQPWPLQNAEADLETSTVATAAGISLPETAPSLLFARRLEVLIWPLRRADSQNHRV
jgi:Uncharacterized conserved protein (COG2071)